ncbi:uncharacterized protein LOC100902681 [Galendromus occidentalis]|uniref:Uncharacterized protein LOC100902681 n=1 Tax=Galendromus occidentalis TaxID=34638 RepID=A0AAJ6VWB5_9ACAR|nr:uncharacterized protein LOC100902681 [Galendromus occidentalis]
MTANPVVRLEVDTATMLPIRRQSQSVREKFFNISGGYDLALCTDASCKDGITSVGITDGCDRWMYRVDDYMGNNIAEMVAIMQALRLALTEFRHPKRLLIGSDSRSVLVGFQSALEKDRTNQYTVALNFGLSSFYEPCVITLMWIPGHKGIPLNVIADQNAGIARQLPDVSILFPQALWSQKTRWCRRNPSDLLHLPLDSELAKHRDADTILESIELKQSFLNCDKRVPGYPEFSWCELCSAGDCSQGHKQTAKHVFMACKALEPEIAELRSKFLSYGIPYELPTILAGYCIEDTAKFLQKVQTLKESHFV